MRINSFVLANWKYGETVKFEWRSVLEPHYCFVLAKLAGVVKLKQYAIENGIEEEVHDDGFYDCLDKNHCGILKAKGYYEWAECPNKPPKISHL